MRNLLSSFTSKWLLSDLSLLLVLFSPPLTVSIPQRQTASASLSIVPTLLNDIREMNYYPENDAWTNMWTRFHPEEIDNGFAKIQTLGFNAVRIILQANTGVFDYPNPTSIEQNKLSQVVTLAAKHYLKVQLTLFDGWSQYTDISGSKHWADVIVKPYATDPRVALLSYKTKWPSMRLVHLPGHKL